MNYKDYNKRFIEHHIQKVIWMCAHGVSHHIVEDDRFDAFYTAVEEHEWISPGVVLTKFILTELHLYE